MIFRSIRWRILSWNFALLAVVVAVLLAAFHRHERENRLQQADVRLRRALVGTLPGVDVMLGRARGGFPMPDEDRGGEDGYGDGRPDGPPDRGPERGGPRRRGPDGPGARGETSTLRALENGDMWCAVFDEERRQVFHTANAPAITAPPAPPKNERGSGEVVALRGGYREIRHLMPGGLLVVMGVPVAALDAECRRLAWELAAIGLLITGSGCAVGWVLAGRSLRPISRISASAERIAAGDYSRTIDIADTESELGRLAVVLNKTFANLHAAREQVIRFTADASHELRTPLAVILAGSQGALKRERSPEEYRATLEATERAAKRMKALSDDLLELARGGAGKEALQTAPCDLADLADEAVAMLAPLAKQHDAIILSELVSCPVEADPLRLGRVVVNLVSNAILHNAPGVSVTVIVMPVNGRAVLEVRDTGKGIPPEHLGKIFDRFHRADASRSRNTGGSGLGLAIVKQVVEAHGGEVTAENAEGGGALLRVSLPLAS